MRNYDYLGISFRIILEQLFQKMRGGVYGTNITQARPNIRDDLPSDTK